MTPFDGVGGGMPDSPFCTLTAARVVDENAHAVLIMDGYPISPGHALVIPKRHVGLFFEVTSVERENLSALSLVARDFQPDGYNIGINDGAAAGQTVQHLQLTPSARKIWTISLSGC